MKKSSPSTRSLPFLTFGALAFALVLLHVDTLRAIRDDEWAGFHSGQIHGMVLALAVYLVPLLLLAVVLDATRKKLRLESGLARHATLAISAWIVWAGIAATASWYPRQYWLLGCCAVGGMGLFLFVLSLPGGRTTIWPAVMCCVLSGLTLVWDLGVSTDFLASPERRIVAMAITAGLSIALALAMGVTLAARGKTRAIAVLAGVAVVLAPFLGHLCWPVLEALNASTRPNLFLVTSDAMRADACEPYAEDRNTPELRALAERGAWFSRSYSCAPWTMPSLVALMSSEYAAEVKGQVSYDRETLALPDARRYAGMPSHETLAEALANQGYETGAFLGNSLLRSLRVGNDGFHTVRHFDFLVSEARGPFTHTPLALAALRRFGYTPPVRPVDLTAHLVVLTKSFFRLQAFNRDPFFLWVHFGDPHAPYTPPPRFCPTPALAGQMRHMTKETWPPMPIGKHYFERLSETEEATLMELYDGEVRYVDAAIGQVMRDAEGMGLIESTFVCMTSDHGEEFWEHECWGHGCTMYEPGVRVPLMVSGPGIAKRGPQDVPVSGYDLAPTLTRLLGLDIPDEWMGTDLSAWLLGQADPPADRALFMQGTLPFVEIPPQQALVRNQDKLIRTQPEGRLQLYDLGQDPDERDDLSKTSAEFTSELLDAMDAHAEQAPVPPPLKSLDGGEDFTEELRAMGYL